MKDGGQGGTNGDGFPLAIGTPVADASINRLGSRDWLVLLLRRMERRCRAAEAILKNAQDNGFGKAVGVYTFDMRVDDHLAAAKAMDDGLTHG